MEILKIVNYMDFSLWDVKRFTQKTFDSKFPISELKDHITLNRNKIPVHEFKNKEIGILGVSNKIGIFDSYIENSDKLNQPYYEMKTNDIAYNPYRINVGSIGIKRKNNKYNYISPAYIVFSAKETILPEYLYLIFKTNIFNKYIKNSTTGSVRQNLKREILEKMWIPIPTLKKQEKLTVNYNQKIELAKKQKEKINEIKKEMNSYLVEELEITLTNEQKFGKGLNIINSKEAINWSLDHLKKEIELTNIKSGKYKSIHLNEVIVETLYGSSEKLITNKTDYPVLRMNNIQEGELNLTKLKYGSFSERDKEKYKLENGDLLFNRTNSKELVGKSAVFEETKSIFGYASYLIKVRINKDIANVKFINYILNSSIGRKQIDLVSRQVTGQANVNAEELKTLLIPFPSLEKQNEIVEKLDKLREQKNKLKRNSEENKIKALETFEKEIFI